VPRRRSPARHGAQNEELLGGAMAKGQEKPQKKNKPKLSTKEKQKKKKEKAAAAK
jgi:hypothetical protein